MKFYSQESAEEAIKDIEKRGFTKYKRVVKDYWFYRIDGDDDPKITL